jgi:hypothetical protein
MESLLLIGAASRQAGFPGSSMRLPADRSPDLLCISVDINKDVVRRTLAARFRPASGLHGLPWFTAQSKASLRGIDLFGTIRCEFSIT